MTDQEPVRVGTRIDLTAQFLIDEIQTLTPSGSATGGSVDLTHRGQTVTAVPFDATALDVQEALAELSTVGPDGVLCWGGPWPASAIFVKFAGPVVRKRNHPLLTITPHLTGGTSPMVTATTTQPGGLIEPDTVEAWIGPEGAPATAGTPTGLTGDGVWNVEYTPTVEGLHVARFKATSTIFGTLEHVIDFTVLPRQAEP